MFILDLLVGFAYLSSTTFGMSSFESSSCSNPGTCLDVFRTSLSWSLRMDSAATILEFRVDLELVVICVCQLRPVSMTSRSTSDSAIRCGALVLWVS